MLNRGVLLPQDKICTKLMMTLWLCCKLRKKKEVVGKKNVLLFYEDQKWKMSRDRFLRNIARQWRYEWVLVVREFEESRNSMATTETKRQKRKLSKLCETELSQGETPKAKEQLGSTRRKTRELEKEVQERDGNKKGSKQKENKTNVVSFLFKKTGRSGSWETQTWKTLWDRVVSGGNPKGKPNKDGPHSVPQCLTCKEKGW